MASFPKKSDLWAIQDEGEVEVVCPLLFLLDFTGYGKCSADCSHSPCFDPHHVKYALIGAAFPIAGDEVEELFLIVAPGARGGGGDD